MDIERALANHIGIVHPSLGSNVLVYADNPPPISRDKPLYAIVQVADMATGYTMGGRTSGRWTIGWQLELVGLRSHVVQALADLPSELTAHTNADGIIIMMSALSSTEAPVRANEEVAGVARAVMHFETEVIG